MIKITVEMWPKGNEQGKYLLGEAIIRNVGSGSAASGDYEAVLMKSAYLSRSSSTGVWKRTFVTAFPRQRLGPWDLIYQALRQMVSGRNGG